jgi:hypothetical protein
MKCACLSLFQLSLLVCLIACAPGHDKAAPSVVSDRQKTEAQFEEVILEPSPLSSPGANGVSRNSITFSLVPGTKEKRVLIPFHYTTGNYKKENVMKPSVEAQGCSGPAVVAGEGGFPYFLWDGGWVLAEEASIVAGYGIEEDVSKNDKETIVLVFRVPSDCTGIRTQFKVVFR